MSSRLSSHAALAAPTLLALLVLARAPESTALRFAVATAAVGTALAALAVWYRLRRRTEGWPARSALLALALPPALLLLGTLALTVQGLFGAGRPWLALALLATSPVAVGAALNRTRRSLRPAVFGSAALGALAPCWIVILVVAVAVLWPAALDPRTRLLWAATLSSLLVALPLTLPLAVAAAGWAVPRLLIPHPARTDRIASD